MIFMAIDFEAIVFVISSVAFWINSSDKVSIEEVASSRISN